MIVLHNYAPDSPLYIFEMFQVTLEDGAFVDLDLSADFDEVLSRNSPTGEIPYSSFKRLDDFLIFYSYQHVESSDQGILEDLVDDIIDDVVDDVVDDFINDVIDSTAQDIEDVPHEQVIVLNYN